MSTRSFVECDCCHRVIEAGKESWLILSMSSNQCDNRAFVQFDGKTFTTDKSGSYVASCNGTARFDVCQICAPRFGVSEVRGDPEYAREELAKNSSVDDGPLP